LVVEKQNRQNLSVHSNEKHPLMARQARCRRDCQAGPKAIVWYAATQCRV